MPLTVWPWIGFTTLSTCSSPRMGRCKTPSESRIYHWSSAKSPSPYRTKPDQSGRITSSVPPQSTSSSQLQPPPPSSFYNHQSAISQLPPMLDTTLYSSHLQIVNWTVIASACWSMIVIDMYVHLLIVEGCANFANELFSDDGFLTEFYWGML